MTSSGADKYIKLTQREHILHRPGMYIGDTTEIMENKYIIDDSGTFKCTSVQSIPGILKLFDEAITNITDQYVRHPDSVNNVKVVIPDNLYKECVVIQNNGPGIPIVRNKEGIYIPTMIFSELLSGENYDDTQQRLGAGTNGLGIKLLNIFSKVFTLECVTSNVKFKQTFTDNNSLATDVEITKCRSKDYVKLTFLIDFDKFNISGDYSIYKNIFISRIYELLVVMRQSNVNIFVNDNKLPKIKKFVDYAKLYDFVENPLSFTICNCELIIVPHNTGKTLTWVNGNFTKNNGKHYDTIIQQLHKEFVKKKNFTGIKLKDIKDNLSFIISATIVNPTFSSQNKDQLTSTMKFDFDYAAIVKKILTTEFKAKILAIFQKQDTKELEKAVKKRFNIPNFDDAINAGKNGNDCTLFLTEGLSARSFVVSGLSELDKKNYGTLPLKGKVLNTREASTKQLTGNQEINSIIKAVGLEFGKKYDEKSVSRLRYRRICIAADSDCDGIHIIGLLINFIHTFWPELLELQFIIKLKTPLIKVLTKDNKIHKFYTQKEYNDTADSLQIKSVKFYKGLGTSTSEESKEIFRDYHSQIQQFIIDPDSNKSICLAFEKTQANNRKTWLTNFVAENSIETHHLDKITFSDFINNNLITFSLYDCQRSIPNVLDGFKPSQRKVLYTMLSQNNNEIKVAQLGARVAQITNYHHGEVSLFGTIVNLAQDYPGSNNLNLLQPIGQFGSRLSLGKDHASPRYIFTKLNDIVKYIYLDSDTPLLTQITEDLELIEPYHYVPVIPMILVNGTLGIGTGFSSNVNMYNPLDICDIIIDFLTNKTTSRQLKPWYRHFQGEVTDKFIKGKYTFDGKNTIIEEIPIDKSISDFSDALTQEYTLLDNKSTENTVYFKVKGALQDKFIETHLISKQRPDTNMWLFNAEQRLQKFTTPMEIMMYFMKYRLKFLKRKREYLLKVLQDQLHFLSEKQRFILLVVSGHIILNRLTKQDLIITMKSNDFTDSYIQQFIKLPVYTLTQDEIAKLQQKTQEKQLEYDAMLQMTNVGMYLKDIFKLKEKLQ